MVWPNLAVSIFSTCLSWIMISKYGHIGFQFKVGKTLTPTFGLQHELIMGTSQVWFVEIQLRIPDLHFITIVRYRCKWAHIFTHSKHTLYPIAHYWWLRVLIASVDRLVLALRFSDPSRLGALDARLHLNDLGVQINALISPRGGSHIGLYFKL